MTEETKKTAVEVNLNEISVDDLYALLDGILHEAMTNCPNQDVVKAAEILHKEVLETANFDFIKVRNSDPDSKPLSDRVINAMYKVHNPYGDEEKGN